MLSISAAEFARKAPWLVLFPGIAISLVVLASIFSAMLSVTNSTRDSAERKSETT
jgi:ABC-type dipeptide/oligopeptide/nickel transport system permease subunit